MRIQIPRKHYKQQVTRIQDLFLYAVCTRNTAHSNVLRSPFLICSTFFHVKSNAFCSRRYLFLVPVALNALDKEENRVPSHLLAPSVMMVKASSYFLDSYNCYIQENFAIFYT